MCIIIDANCASKFAMADPESQPIAKWLMKRSSKIVIGGTKLKNEYSKLSKFAALAGQLAARGQVKSCDDEKTDALQAKIESENIISSDDPHIIAIAIISGARLLYSNDHALHADFGSTDIIKPKGRVYQNASHAHLLADAVC